MTAITRNHEKGCRTAPLSHFEHCKDEFGNYIHEPDEAPLSPDDVPVKTLPRNPLLDLSLNQTIELTEDQVRDLTILFPGCRLPRHNDGKVRVYNFSLLGSRVPMYVFEPPTDRHPADTFLDPTPAVQPAGRPSEMGEPQAGLCSSAIDNKCPCPTPTGVKVRFPSSKTAPVIGGITQNDFVAVKMTSKQVSDAEYFAMRFESLASDIIDRVKPSAHLTAALRNLLTTKMQLVHAISRS